MLLKELSELQARAGWLSEAGLREIAERRRVPLHRLESLSTFYTHFRRSEPPRRELGVCRDVACGIAGRGEALDRLRPLLDELGVELREVSCLGRCDGAPAGCVGECAVDLRNEAELRAALDDPASRERPIRSWSADPYASRGERYGALRRWLDDDPARLLDELEAAGLRGLGGAGFPTARKWRLVASRNASPKYVICNADESEPGSFKDREVLHDLPHLVIEGMALAGLAVGASSGILFIRHEYAAERQRFDAELAAAREAGALGERIFDSDFCFDVEIFVSPGGYILGEETALLECLEDRRGEPRNKPPFPGVSGLYGQPTLINNVETLAHAAAIAERGSDWWHALAPDGFAGHKFMAVSGDVAEPGVVLVPMGTTLGQLLDACGGMKDGAAVAAVAPGGASSSFLPGAALDVALDFDALSEAGSMLGSGAAIFVAEGRNLLEVGLDVARFFRNESCGKCVPCRVGTEKAVALLESQPLTPALLGQLRALHATLARTSICGLGQIALAPLLSIVDLSEGAARG
ncbi:MAG: NAD(P)H-dependent oxidoreductase subunit E [Myxococcota bacterium]|nr:NAD(P)H-dependent oxidoreductase subunit E [Myxococcota bacterium]